MKKNSHLIFRLAVILGDAAAILMAFFFAFYFRTHIDPRPYYFTARPIDFLTSIVFIVPIWIVVLAALGLYQKNIFLSKTRFPELIRLFFASILGTMVIITVSFFKNEDIFPVRVVAVYSTIICLILLIIFRWLIRLIRRIHYNRSGHKLAKAIIIGNSKTTRSLAEYIHFHPESGYRIVAIVAGSKLIPKDLKKYQFSSLKEALKKIDPDVIFQTDEKQTEYVYKQSLNVHVPYYFIPSEAALSSQLGDLELIGNTPAILVRVTPLTGWGRIVKRCSDIIFGGILFILALIPMLIVWLSIKLSDPKHNALYSDIRLTRFNRKFKIYKFRSMKSEYSGMTPEEAFIKMGKPELIKKYRKNGDYLEKDPRITKIGAFIRKTSLDELPQLWNVIKGDISLVGPRALVPGELRNYGNRSLLLSVKSGLTGLAQVSGRREIAFEERRQLDLYYISNWSIFMDIQILFKTVATVFRHEGAK